MGRIEIVFVGHAERCVAGGVASVYIGKTMNRDMDRFNGNRAD